MSNLVITIGREFGSGGRELGRRLADELGIDYYDKEIITAIAKDTAMTEDYIRSIVENRPHHLFPITVGHSMALQNDYQMLQTQEIYRAHTQIITDLAAKSSCVIIGRCADYILRDSNPVRIFVHADLDSRIARCMARRTEEEAGLTEQDMRKRIQNVDRSRAAFYNDFTGQRWGDKKYYDLCVNTTNVSIKEIAPYLARMFRGGKIEAGE